MTALPMRPAAPVTRTVPRSSMVRYGKLDATTWPSVVPAVSYSGTQRSAWHSSPFTVRKKRAMRTTGVSGRLLRLAVVMVPMFGLLVLAQAPPPPPQPAPAPAQAGQAPPARRPAAAARLSSTTQRRRGLLAQAADQSRARRRNRRRRSSFRRAIAWSSSSPNREVISPAVDRVRRQRPDVRRRVRHLHARRRRQQPAHAREPHHALREHQGRRRLRQAHGLRRQARAAAHGPAARRQQHPDQRDRIRRRRQVHRHQQRRRRRQARALLLGRRHRPRRQPRTRAERLHLGPRQLDLQHLQRLPHSAGRRTASSRSRPDRTAASGA